MPVLYQRLSTTQFVFLVTGGLLYTIGIPVLLRRRPDPWPATFGYHEIFHSLVTAAAGAHYAVIVFAVLPLAR